ncbi:MULTISPECIES: hypothetical protein [unclassified Streptomyces]|uniref:hypothetical protein n=1 Tax=unclassified Streptomyces TaxID=2593676 RepID=UPI0035E1300F
MLEEMQRCHGVLIEHDSLIRTALRVYAERMDENAKEFQEAYEAGQADPEVKAQQDKSYVTNYGRKHAAEMSRQSAESARKASDAILDAILGPDEDESNA